MRPAYSVSDSATKRANGLKMCDSISSGNVDDPDSGFSCVEVQGTILQTLSDMGTETTKDLQKEVNGSDTSVGQPTKQTSQWCSPLLSSRMLRRSLRAWLTYEEKNTRMKRSPTQEEEDKELGDAPNATLDKMPERSDTTLSFSEKQFACLMCPVRNPVRTALLYSLYVSLAFR